MKTRLAALGSALALTLLMSTAWGDKPIGSLQVTTLWEVPPNEDDVFACPGGTTEFTDAFQTLPGDNIQTFPIPGVQFPGETFDVTVTITVNSDESFDFDVTGGWIHEINVKAGLAEFFYDYNGFGPDDPENLGEQLNKVSSDTGLNRRIDPPRSQEVSHLDFCLSAQELPPNTELLSSCLEGSDGVPPGEESEGGCFPSGPAQQVEFPNEVGGTADINNLLVTQKLVPAKPTEPPDSVCPGDFVAKDPRVDVNGNVVAIMEQDLSVVFDLSGIEPLPPNGVFLRADTVGSPCLALIHGNNNFGFEDLTDVQPNGGVSTVTQFPEDVPGMFDNVTRITAPLSETQPDLQFVEQAAYQPDDLNLLVELLGSPFTNDVFNASRTRSFKGSIYFLNTREVCLSLDPMLDPSDGVPYFEAVQQCKIDLAVEYFFNLEQALNEAEPNLISPSLNRLLRDHSRALSMIKTGNWDKGINRLNDLRDQVDNGQWNVDFQNDPGNLIMRIDNLIWRTEQLKLAEALNAL